MYVHVFILISVWLHRDIVEHILISLLLSPLQGPTSEHVHSARRPEYGWQHPNGPTGQDCQESWPRL